MNTLAGLYRLVLMLSPMVLPWLIGILVYFRLRRYHRFLAHSVAFLIPPLLTFYFLRMTFIQEMTRYYAETRSGCGMPGLAAAIVLLGATAFQIFLSFLTQAFLYLRRH